MVASTPKLQSSKVEVVLLGRFDPNAVHPQKLANAGLIIEAEAKAATWIGLLPNHIAEFETDWLKVAAIPDRLVLSSTKTPYIRLADLAIRIAREITDRPALTALGINREYFYRYDTSEERDEFAVKLCPPHAWGAWGEAIEKSLSSKDAKIHGGVLNIKMRQMSLEGKEFGFLDVSISPSPLPEDFRGVQIQVNDHYATDPARDPEVLDPETVSTSRTSRLLEMLVHNFDASLKRSEAIVQEIL